MLRPIVTVDPLFRERLRALRTSAGLSYRDLSEAVNYSHTTLWEVEAGHKRPNPDMATAADIGGLLGR